MPPERSYPSVLCIKHFAKNYCDLRKTLVLIALPNLKKHAGVLCIYYFKLEIEHKLFTHKSVHKWAKHSMHKRQVALAQIMFSSMNLH